MTSHSQPTGWGSQGWNQNSNWGCTGWNPSSAWNQTAGWNPSSAWNQTAGWNPSTAWNQTAGWNPSSAWNQTAGWNPSSAWNQTAGWNPSTAWNQTAGWNPSTAWNQTAGWNPSTAWEQGATVAFVPHQSPISGGSFIPSHGIGSGISTAGIPSGWQGGNQTLTGVPFGNTSISQSFAAELTENNHEFVVSFDVPGIDVEDLDVSLAGNTIFINGIRKGSQEATTLAYSEIAKGNITRAISVPFDVSPSKAINTSLDNGVLKIRISKESQSDKRTSTRKVKIG